MTTKRGNIVVPILCGAIIVFFVGLTHRYVQNTALNSDVFKLDNSTTCLVVGDSHTETALDPELLPNTANISKSAENFFYTYYKLKHFLKHNPQIRRVILGTSYHNFTRFSEAYIFDDKKNYAFLDSYYLLFDEDGRRFARSSSSNYIISYLKYDIGLPVQTYGKAYNNNIFINKIFGIKLKKSDFNFYGKFYKINTSTMSEEYINSKVSELYKTSFDTYVGNSEAMTIYFTRILSLCKENNIELYLYNGPLYKNLLDKIPPEAVTYFNYVISKALSEFGNIKYIDDTKLLHDKNYFANGDHVNASGSYVVSMKLLKEVAAVIDN